MKRVILAICTYSRECAFQTCMETISRLALPEGVAFSVLVVENGAENYARRVMEAMPLPFDWQVINAPNMGLVNVRNAAIEGFLAAGGDWLGFIDDDEEVDPNWLRAMTNAIDTFPEARAFAGPTFELLPDGKEVWFPRRYSSIKTGTPTMHCGTGNVLLHRVIFEDDGLALRFDLRFNYSGAEDRALFNEMAQLNQRILWVPDAVCHELVPPERQRFRWRAAVKIRVYSNSGRLQIIKFGGLLGRIILMRRILHWSLGTTGHAILALVTLPFGRRRNREHIVQMVTSASVTVGYSHAFLGLKKRTYLRRAAVEVEAEA